jgi:ATPase family associated with various cellular activities (AAA)
MNAALSAPNPADAFGDLPFAPAQHLRLALFGVIARVIESCTDGDLAAALQTHPFLADYLGEMQARLAANDSLAARWWLAVCEWERVAMRQEVHLPLVALRDAGLSALELELLLAVGLVEEDPRFGNVFEHAQRHERRPTFGLLMAWWREGAGDDDRADGVRSGLQRLIDYGLLQLPNPEVPRADWTPAVVLAVWDALRGEAPALRWLRHLSLTALPGLSEHIAPEEAREACAALPDLLASDPAPVLLVRGPAHNGRKTLAGALARSLGKSALIVREAAFEDDARWRLLGALAAMTNAVPIVELELAPGESRVLPPLLLADAPLIVVTGRHGAWGCADARPMLAVDLPLPGVAQRLQHWQACLPVHSPATLIECATQMRLASGSIRAVAATASGFARLAGRATLEREDLRRACRTLQSARLETLATRLESRGTLHDLTVDDSTREELSALLARCRWREQLAAESVAAAMGGVGVRALFAGPSGTGKTLAARLLAAELGKDVYRVDLAATVNKYLGETEKNLNRALSAAEELDVVLLLDEGDALMANRTDVGSSNDRYANLETNFLLQRIESFEGILLVTTNAADRVDRAFARRMDVVVNFRTPGEWERYGILRMHLGDAHGIDDGWLQDAAQRCALSGGQWRNVATHARLLALQSGQAVTAEHLYAALAREYRKTGGLCPLRPMRTG